MAPIRLGKIGMSSYESQSALGDELIFFKKELEYDSEMFFHATPAKNFSGIVELGFKTGKQLFPDKSDALCSISFARNSIDTRHHIRTRRSNGETWIIIAVRFSNLVKPDFNNEKLYLYVSKNHPQPEIVDHFEVPFSMDV
ncbi:MAG: hypothetical protein JKY83_02945 [Rhizobiaceae bacterium]|nr:hypothetical protein [Rhizobiaceae bacterium]